LYIRGLMDKLKDYSILLFEVYQHFQAGGTIVKILPFIFCISLFL